MQATPVSGGKSRVLRRAISQHIWSWTSHWLHFCTSSVLCLTEHTGGAHSATWAELNGLWSKGLIKRRHTTCPLALHFVHSGFMGKTMQARFPTRIGDLQWTSTEKTWENGNKRCGLKIVLSVDFDFSAVHRGRRLFRPSPIFEHTYGVDYISCSRKTLKTLYYWKTLVEHSRFCRLCLFKKKKSMTITLYIITVYFQC